jgi:hypothetical protein
MKKDFNIDSKEVGGRTVRALKTLHDRYQLRECFYKDDSCSSNIIKAHSVQRNRVLKNISDNGHVMMFQVKPFEEDHRWEPDKIGLNKATVFTGFCEYHDQEIFKPIDLYDYEEGNEEQEFLFAYKALAKEHHIKLSMTKSYEKISEWTENNNYAELKKHHLIKEKEEIIRLQALMPQDKHTLKELKAGSRCLNISKDRLNNNLQCNRYNNIVTRIIALDGNYPIACSSCISLEKDFNGNLINDLRKLNFNLKYLFLTIFPQDSHTFILLSFFRKERDFFKFIDTQILNKDEDEQMKLISNLLLKHVENFTMSPSHWNTYTKETKDCISNVFSKNIHLDTNLKDIQDLNLFV